MSTQSTAFNTDEFIKGIDVSHNNGAVDWATVSAAGISFAFAKATEGKAFKDAQFNLNYATMKNNGIIRGAYHFFHPDIDATAQAENFLQLVPTVGAGDLPPALDVEVNDNIIASDIIQGIQVWTDVVSKALRCNPIIYTSASFWDANLDGTDKFDQHPLWVAHYTSKPQPNIPRGFSSYAIWQFSEEGSVGGIGGKVDLNRFNGTATDLRKMAGIES
jgi:lysozyme